MNTWMNEYMNEWMNTWMNEYMNKWMNTWMNEYLNKLIHEWMNESFIAVLNSKESTGVGVSKNEKLFLESAVS